MLFSRIGATKTRGFLSGLVVAPSLRALVIFAALGGLPTLPAVAQTQAINVAQIGLSGGVSDANPGNNQSSAVVKVTPPPVVTYSKSAFSSSPTVKVGDTVSYTLTVTISNAATDHKVTLTDTLGAGLDFGVIANAGSFTCTNTAPLVCSLAAGTAPGTYALSYNARVNARASGSVTNLVVGAGGDNPVCSGSCSTITTVSAPQIRYSKSSNAAQAIVGDVITYSLTTVVSNAATTAAFTLEDTLGAGLDFAGWVDAGAFTCNAANPLVCTLPAGTPAGTYAIQYRAAVNATASGSVSNGVVGTGGDNPSCSGNCNVNTPIVAPEVSFSKSVNVTGPVEVGDVLAYTLTTIIANSKTTGDVVLLTDTLGTGLDFIEVLNAGSYTVDPSDAPVVRFRLPTGTPPGTYAVTYTARVNDAATGTVSNVVVGSGTDTPTCTTGCSTNTPVAASEVRITKVASAPSAPVKMGDLITYTVTATVSKSSTTGIVKLTDTLGEGLDFVVLTDAGAYNCNRASPLICSLPAGAHIGTYSVTYTARVNGEARGAVTNAVLAAGPDNPGCATCTTSTPVADPEISVIKSSNAAQAKVGDVIIYSLQATVANAATDDVLTLTDTLGAGLDFGGIVSGGGFNCATGNPLNCTLAAGSPAGVYTIVYTAIVNETASGSVSNIVIASGGDNPDCASCGTSTPIIAPDVSFAKSVDAAGKVRAGDVLTFTLTTTIANSKTTGDTVLLTDTLGTGLDFVAVLNAGNYNVDDSGAPIVRFTLPTGTAPGNYSVTYTARVNEQASGSVSNIVVGSGADNPSCTTACGTNTPVAPPVVTYRKSSNAQQVKVGDVISYALTAVVTNAATVNVLTLTDTLGNGLALAGVTDAGAFACNAAAPLICTLPAGTATGTYEVRYTARVTADASGSVSNSVVGTGGDNPLCVGGCSTNASVIDPAVSYAKTADVTGAVKVGDVITFTLTTTVANSRITDDVVLLTDTLGKGLDFVSVVSQGDYAVDDSGAPVVRFTLPAGKGPGTYRVVYRARVNESAAGSVANIVVGTGDDGPACTTGCGTNTPVSDALVTYFKTVDAAEPVAAGDLLTYKLTVKIQTAALSADVTLTDTLGEGLDFVQVTDAGAFSCNAANPLVCTLPAGTSTGVYTLSYTARVNAQATGSVTNAVVASGDNVPACEGVCRTVTSMGEVGIGIVKTASVAAGAILEVGDQLEYLLTITVTGGATTEELTLRDVPDAGLTLQNLPPLCTMSGAEMLCTLPAGLATGTHTLRYTALVNDAAQRTVGNQVTASGGGAIPDCTSCSVTHKVRAPEIRLVKTATAGEARIGDLIRYTLTVENVGTRDLIDGRIGDMPPAGFTYVEGSLQVVDTDNAATIFGQSPIRFENVDVRVGEKASLVYLMRVGAGVRRGTQTNEAQTFTPDDRPVSNRATASVEIVGDPLIDETLLFGTVFDDRDGDGWQDSAALSGLHVRGGFAPGAYIPGSTTIERGDGPEAVAGAGAPLLSGMNLGALSGRQSEADDPDNHRIIVRQRLNQLAFTNDFVLTSRQGVTLRMDATGATRVETSGDAARGLNAAQPTVERRIAQGEGGYVVDYVIRNAGIDERGIPGVRIASVEGLLIETDQYGRFHLEGVPGTDRAFGRNFVLKVDPATLPANTRFTTDNPLLRRITPGIPVRFDWGVKLPVTVIEGGEQGIELELGQLIFAPASAAVQDQYLPLLERMADTIKAYRGGEVVIAADGDTHALALQRAEAMKAALMARLDADMARKVVLSVRTRADDAATMVAGLDEAGARLGTILFDTDRAEVRPEYQEIIEHVAALLEKRGGGTVAIVGHTDVRGAFEYNTELGLRRARAVFDALAGQLSPDVRAKTRVESSSDPSAPVDMKR